MDVVDDSRRIEGDGSSSSEWLQWLQGSASASRLPDPPVPPGRRLAIVSPHPDDEILMCGGLLASHFESGGDCLIVAVTDGDMSHAGSPTWTPETLSLERRRERLDGLRALGAYESFGASSPPTSSNLELQRLGITDGAVTERVDWLTMQLTSTLRSTDIVVTTWHLDGHPDHDASGLATLRAAESVGCQVLEAPVWMWHWAQPGDARVPWKALASFQLETRHARRKAAAIALHTTQLTPRARRDAPPLEPVLGPQILARAAWPCEYFLSRQSS